MPELPERTIGRLACVATLASFAISCVSPGATVFDGGHWQGETWSRSFSAQTDDPWQWIPEATWLGLTPIAFAADSDVHDDAEDHTYVTGGDTKSGDLWANALGFGSLAYTGWLWIDGDGGRSAEAAAEAMLYTGASTQLLKVVTQRQRPENGTHDSFPSGHTSFAFAGATIFARCIEEQSGTKYGYLSLLPAAYVAIDRVEGSRHWPSDVVFGAFLGTTLTNWTWNAHYGDTRQPGIFVRPNRAAWRITPVIDEQTFALSLSASW